MHGARRTANRVNAAARDGVAALAVRALLAAGRLPRLVHASVETIRRSAFTASGGPSWWVLLTVLLSPVLSWAGGGYTGSSHNDLTSLLLPTMPNILMVYIPAIAVLAIVYIVAFLRPEVGLLFYVALLPFRSLTLLKFGGAVVVASDITVFPMVIGWFLHGTFRHEQPRLPFRRSGIDAPLVAFLFLCQLSTYWSVGYMGTFSKVIQFVYALILFYSGLEIIKSPKLVPWIMMFWSIGALVNSGSSVFTYLTHHIRSGGLNINSLETATYMLFGLSLSMGFWIGLRNTWARIIVFLSLLVQLAGFLIANCRGPMLGLAAGFIIPFLVDKEVRKLALWGVVGVVAGYGVAVMGAVMTPGAVIPNPFMRFSHAKSLFDLGEAYRIDIWSSIIHHVIPAAPILGVGAGSLDGLLMNWGHRALGPEHTAHSMYLEVLAGLGPIGFGLMMWFWIGYMWLLWKYYRRIREPLMRGIVLGGLCAAISKCVAGSTYGFFIEDRYQWTTLGIVLGIAKLGMEMQGERTVMSDPGPLVLWPGGEGEVEPEPVAPFAPGGQPVPRYR